MASALTSQTSRQFGAIYIEQSPLAVVRRLDSRTTPQGDVTWEEAVRTLRTSRYVLDNRNSVLHRTASTDLRACNVGFRLECPIYESAPNVDSNR